MIGVVGAEVQGRKDPVCLDVSPKTPAPIIFPKHGLRKGGVGVYGDHLAWPLVVGAGSMGGGHEWGQQGVRRGQVGNMC
jgi:hypothetical protein